MFILYVNVIKIEKKNINICIFKKMFLLGIIFIKILYVFVLRILYQILKKFIKIIFYYLQKFFSIFLIFLLYYLKVLKIMFCGGLNKILCCVIFVVVKGFYKLFMCIKFYQYIRICYVYLIYVFNVFFVYWMLF